MKPALAVFVLVAGLATSCAKGDRDANAGRKPPASGGDQPAPSAPKESRVFDLKTSDDLLALNSEYQRLWDSGFDGKLEVAVGPGPIVAGGWSLEPGTPGGTARIDVVIRGSGGVLPLPGRVRARSLRLENLAITGARSGPTEIHVATDFTMKRVMVVDARFSDPNFAGGYLEVFADGGKKNGTKVSIEESWFVRNYQADSPMQMISLLQRGEDAGHFDAVRVSRSAFLNNAFAVDLAIAYAGAVSVEDSLFYRTWPTGAEIRCTSCGAAELKRTTFVVEKVDQVAAVDATPAVQVTDSRVLIRDWKGGKPPAALVGAPGQFVERTADGDGAVNEAIATLTAQPIKVPSPELFQRLQSAFAAGK